MASNRRSPVSMPPVDAHTCTPHVRQQVLAHVPFFRDLDAAEIEAIDARCRVRDFGPGEAVHLAGQPARELFVVATGTAKQTRPTLEGTEVLLDVLRPGDYFGAIPALGITEHPDSVWPLTPLCVLSLDTDTFDEILDEHPSVARAGLRIVAERLEHARVHIHHLATATAEQRVSGALVMLAERTGVPRAGGQTLLDLPLSREDLAGLTGSASETVSRVLAQLRRDELIETGRRWVAVRDLDRLRALAEI